MALQNEAFRCVACVGTVSLFPTYTAAYSHSGRVHQVTLEQAIQSSILLPRSLVAFNCKLCAEGKEKLFLSEDSVKIHLGTHSVFFAKKWKMNSCMVCRICDVSLDETTLENHMNAKHPNQMFADENDVIDVSENVANAKIKEEIILESTPPPVSEYNEEESKKAKEVKLAKVSKSGGSKIPDNSQLWDSFKPEQLVAAYFPYFPRSSRKKPKTQYPKILNLDKDNNNEKTVSIKAVKSEDIDDKDLTLHTSTPSQAEMSENKRKTREQEELAKMIKSSCKLNTKGGEDVYNASNSLDDENNQPLTISTSSPNNFKFESALIPLPCLDYPSHSTTLQPMLYTCTVCSPSSSIFSFPSWVIHRQSKTHRLAYGKAFSLNKCIYFPDAFYDTRHASLQSSTCHKCNIDFTDKDVLNLHIRRRHPLVCSYPIADPYCHTCKMPLLTYPDSQHHSHYIVHDMTSPCNMCDMRVYRDGMGRHLLSAHPDKLFKCEHDGCKDAREGSSEYYSALHVHPGKLLQHMASVHQQYKRFLTTFNCRFPASLVKISCRKCDYHFLGEDENQMVNHLKLEHELDHRSEYMNFSCRLCKGFGKSIPGVKEHSKKHTKNMDWDVASSSKTRSGTCSSSRDHQGNSRYTRFRERDSSAGSDRKVDKEESTGSDRIKKRGSLARSDRNRNIESSAYLHRNRKREPSARSARPRRTESSEESDGNRKKERSARSESNSHRERSDRSRRRGFSLARSRSASRECNSESSDDGNQDREILSKKKLRNKNKKTRNRSKSSSFSSRSDQDRKRRKHVTRSSSRT